MGQLRTKIAAMPKVAVLGSILVIVLVLNAVALAIYLSDDSDSVGSDQSSSIVPASTSTSLLPLDVRVDKSPPKFVIDNPADQAVFSTNPARFSGTVDYGSTVIAGNKAVVVDSRGNWSVNLDLAEGENVLTFTATDRSGNKTVTDITVFLSPLGSNISVPLNCPTVDLRNVVQTSLRDTIVNDAGAEFSINLAPEYIGLGLNATAQRSASKWNIHASISDLPLIGDLELTVIIEDEVMYLSAPGVLETFIGGKTWASVDLENWGSDGSANAYEAIAPSPISEGVDDVDGIATCKFVQLGISVEDLLGLLSEDFMIILEQFAPGFSTAPDIDVTFYLAADGTTRRLTAGSDGATYLYAEVTNWGAEPTLIGRPAEQDVAIL